MAPEGNALKPDIGDTTRCPLCVAKNKNGSGCAGYASRYFNAIGKLYVVCEVHRVRWFVTDALAGIPTEADQPGSSLDLPEVEGVL